MEMIKQNLDFSNTKQVMEFMEKVFEENRDFLSQHEEKIIKKQLKYFFD